MSSNDGPGPDVTTRLGYLLKHAQLRMHELTDHALEPHGVTGRELAVLIMLAGHEPASQQQAAQRLGVDRTTMVALLDALEHRGLVTRHPHAEDRRRNVVELTQTGHEVTKKATKAGEQAEREFLAALDPETAQRFRDTLHTLVVGQPA